MNKTVINELNAFLEGNFMAVHGYERYINQASEPEIKKALQNIQQDHKTHGAKVAERIQDLGGVPVDGPGAKGAMADMMNKFKMLSKDTQENLKKVKEDEDKGIQMAEEIVKGDLDPESKRLIQAILDDDRRHVEVLNGLIQ